MDDATLSALKESIERWKDNERLAGLGLPFPISIESFPLCGLHCSETEENFALWCNGCPVDEAGGNCFRIGSPYANAVMEIYRAGSTRRGKMFACRYMVSALDSLLTEQEES